MGNYSKKTKHGIWQDTGTLMSQDMETTVTLGTVKFPAGNLETVSMEFFYKTFWFLQGMRLLSQDNSTPALCDSHYLEPELLCWGLKQIVLLIRHLWEPPAQKGNTWHCPPGRLWFYCTLWSTCAKYGHLNASLDLRMPPVPLSSIADGFKECQSKHFSCSGELYQCKCKV